MRQPLRLMEKKPQPEPNRYSPEREQRVAEALRDNLRKRKLQSREQQKKGDKL